MTHTGPMRDSDGTFSASWTAVSEQPCPKCGETKVKYRVWESSCGGYEDHKFKCGSCGHTWWVDGPDA